MLRSQRQPLLDFDMVHILYFAGLAHTLDRAGEDVALPHEARGVCETVKQFVNLDATVADRDETAVVGSRP